MEIQDLKTYVDGLDNLTKIKVTYELDELGTMLCTLTEETYVFEDEEEADQKINNARQNPGFAGVTKKYKAGKVNRAGEVTKSETWTVVLKLNH